MLITPDQVRELEAVVNAQAAERRAFIKAWEENTPAQILTPQELGITPEVEGENRTCENCSNCQKGE